MVIILLLFFSLSCTRHEKSSIENRFQKIQQKVDRREYTEAEAELQAILAQEPENERARVILASISVHKAGITLKEYFSLEKLSHLSEVPQTKFIQVENLEKLKIAKNSDFAKALTFLKQVDQVAARVQEIIKKFNQIPEVDEEGLEHLRVALVELNKVKNISDGNALYRGVIKLFYFKTLWSRGEFLHFGEKQFCSLKLIEIQNILESFQTFTVGMVLDISRGFPKNREEIEKQARAVQTGFVEAQKFIGSISDATKSIEATLKTYAKEQKVEGFQCDF